MSQSLLNIPEFLNSFMGFCLFVFVQSFPLGFIQSNKDVARTLVLGVCVCIFNVKIL